MRSLPPVRPISPSCAAVRAPILFTHHMRTVDAASGALIGAISDFQVERVRDLVTGAGQTFDLLDLPDAAHVMHQAQPERFGRVLGEWISRRLT